MLGFNAVQNQVPPCRRFPIAWRIGALLWIVSKSVGGCPRDVPTLSFEGGSTSSEAEVERVMEAGKGNRWSRQDAAIAYRHGLRTSGLVDLRWVRWT